MGKIRNQGSASLEATLVMSVFLLAMVSLFWMAQSVLAEAQVYEAAAETAEYMAEIAYLGAADTAVAYLRFPKYADEKETVERYVKHGVSGVQFLGSEIGEEPGIAYPCSISALCTTNRHKIRRIYSSI